LSTYSIPLKSTCANTLFPTQLNEKSLVALGRKILSYREIDTPLALACLASLPYDVMVSELKAAIPNIQSDFSRLSTVALIGEQLSQLWEQEELLQVFQSLQTSAKWWHTLTAMGLEIDPRAFQSAVPELREQCIRSILPNLLEKSNLNLSTAIEYCNHFDIEPSAAALCYIEKVLLSKPTLPIDMTWSSLVRRAATRVNEDELGTCLRNVLMKIHPLDYEKIRYVCDWLLYVLADPDDADVTHIPLDVSADGDLVDGGKSLISTLSLSETLAIELKTYERYGHIAKYLSGLTVPPVATSQIPNPPGVEGPYEGLANVYSSRIPMWQLLEDPWSVLEPLMRSCPSIAGKLYPLSAVLALDQNEFYAQRAMCTYSHMTDRRARLLLPRDALDPSGGGTDTALGLVYASPLDAIEEAVDVMTSGLRKVELWRWVFEKERPRDAEVAMNALQRALDCADELSKCSGDPVPERDEVYGELVHVRCEAVTLRLLRAKNACVQRLGVGRVNFSRPDFGTSLQDPTLLLERILRHTVDFAWNVQMAYLQVEYGAVSIDEVVKHSVCGPLKAYLEEVWDACDEVCLYADGGVKGEGLFVRREEGSGAASKVENSLETARQLLFSKLLTDGDASNAEEEGRVNQYGMSAPQASKGPLGAPSWNAMGLQGDANANLLSPTAAERRRREDVFKGFSLGVLIGCCGDLETR